MAEITNNQHFVPQHYLRGFTIPQQKSLIWEFDKKKGQFFKSPKSVRTICSRHHYYLQVREDGTEEPDTLEHGFSRDIESKSAPLFKALISRISNGNREVYLTPAEYGQLCYSVAIQYTRVPSFRDKMAFFMKLHGEQLFDKIVESQRKDGTLPPKVDKILHTERPTVTIESWGTLQTMVEASVTVGKALLNKSPGFFRAPAGNYFITSDNPVSYHIKDFEKYEVKHLEPIHPHAEVFFPLSRNIALVFFPYKSGYGSTRHAIRCKSLEPPPEIVRFVNMHTAAMAERYIYTPERTSDLSKALFDVPKSNT
jgi:hypothetical protein